MSLPHPAFQRSSDDQRDLSDRAFIPQPELLSARRKDAIGSGNGASCSYTPSGRDFEIPGIDAILVNDQLRSPQRPADA